MADTLGAGEQPEFLVALMAQSGGRLHPSGSGSLISSSLILTAKHVLQDFSNQFNDFSLVGITVDSAGVGHRLVAVEVEALEGSDLGLIRFEGSLSEGHELLEIELEPPAVGESVVGYGYTESSAWFAEPGAVGWAQRTLRSSGEVLEVHEQKRDASMLPFPVFMTNGEWPGGMSGGPVLDSKGRLRGVISSSMKGNADWPDYSSYAALVWPLVNHKWSGYQPQSSNNQFVAGPGTVRMHHLERVVPIFDDSGRFMGTSWK